jgi:hypothetical protein
VPRPSTQPIFDVFIGYNHRDREQAQLIADLLSAQRLRVWFDQEALAPGEIWAEAMQLAIATVSCGLVVVGPGGLGHWETMEAHALLDRRAIPVVPVILPGVIGEPALPPFLKQRHSVDLRGGITEERLRPLVEVIREVSSSSASVGLKVPQFHFGGVVPPDFFIGRTEELRVAENAVRARQSFLLVGDYRAGKTSFCEALIHRIMGRRHNDLLVGKLNLESCEDLTLNTFLGHTLINMIGEIARQVFGCRYVDLRTPTSLVRQTLAADPAFQSLLNVHQFVLERTLGASDAARSIVAHEFTRITAELLELIANKGWSGYLMIYDEANHLAEELSIGLLMNNLELLSSARLTTVYAASPQMASSFDGLSAYLPRKVRLGAFDSVLELRQLLGRYYHGDASRIDDLPITRGGERRVWQLSKGMPFRIQCLLGYGLDYAHRRHEPKLTPRDVNQAWAMLQQTLPEYFPRES